MAQVCEEIYFIKRLRHRPWQNGEARRSQVKPTIILYYKSNLPIAVVAAKDNNYSVGTGMQQALEYAEILDAPFAFSSNGDVFLEHGRAGTEGVVEREGSLDQFPTLDEL